MGTSSGSVPTDGTADVVPHVGFSAGQSDLELELMVAVANRVWEFPHRTAVSHEVVLVGLTPKEREARRGGGSYSQPGQDDVFHQTVLDRLSELFFVEVEASNATFI